MITTEQREIVAALEAAGCGIKRTAPEVVPTPAPVPVVVQEVQYQIVPYRRTGPFRLTMQQLLYAVARTTGVGTKDILSTSRLGDITRARTILFSLARRTTKYTSRQIGAFCGRDSSTVRHGINLVRTEPQHYAPEMGKLLEIFKEALR